MKFDNIALNTLRGLSLDMVTQAKSGHPGICLSAAPLLYTLYTRHFKADPSHPEWINRDRFILSAGHGSALLYALLHHAGYEIPLDHLKQFRQLFSITPGHPEVGVTPGVDASAGPLGQGLAQAVGFAMAEAHLQAIYPEGDKLIDHYTYVVTGDGCLEEGISQEAITYAGLQKLNKLILLYDKNEITLDGPLSNSSNEDTKGRFLASGWNVIEVVDGNNIDEIDKALIQAKAEKEKPSIIICHTIIGYGSSLAGTCKSHGSPFSLEEVRNTKKNLGCEFEPFMIKNEAYQAFVETFILRGKAAYSEYEKNLETYRRKHEKEYEEFTKSLNNDISSCLFDKPLDYPEGFKDATRNTSQVYLNLVAEKTNRLFGGAADVAGSVKTNVKKFTDFTAENREGCNINFGIREFLMASIQNGILLHGGLRTYVGCFFVFADYMKAAIRMAAMEKLPAVYLFSHDSIAVGEDGPTHQPIEQLTMLRSMPNVNTLRPADAIEMAACYHIAFSSLITPSALILTRQNLPNNPGSSFEKAHKGGYVISKEKNRPSYTLIASGSEVFAAIEIQKRLAELNIDTRVVSMPCQELFLKQDKQYQDDVFVVPYENRIYLEMGYSGMNYRFAKHVFGIDEYGASGPAELVIKENHFDVQSLYKEVLKIVS